MKLNRSIESVSKGLFFLIENWQLPYFYQESIVEQLTEFSY